MDQFSACFGSGGATEQQVLAVTRHHQEKD